MAGSGDSYVIVFLSCLVLLGTPHTVRGPVAAGPPHRIADSDQWLPTVRVFAGQVLEKFTCLSAKH